MKYRKEVDGLRAFAVLPVIFFHAGFELFSGGFVGVDVFFVISGYLITTIILTDLGNGQFSISDFYERRARRILPALFLVMLVCVPFALLFLLPSDLESFSKSLVAVPLFVSNIFFWRDSGYWDVSADLKPLLHTWSLSVEEQFYLFFPIFLMGFWRFGKKKILAVLLGVWLLSFALAEFASVRKPDAAFFLLPTRGWELLTGAFVAYYLSYSNRVEGFELRWVKEFGAMLGFCFLLYSIFAFDRSTPFPGVYAALPTFGAALIILFANQNTVVGRLLSLKFFVGIGLVSYSAYLWHQPLFAFARYKSFGEENVRLMAVLVFMSIGLAYLSWRFVEKPFRDRRFLSKKNIFMASAVGGFVFVSIGFVGIIFDGFPQRYSQSHQELLALGSRGLKTMEAFGLGRCFINYDQSHKILITSNCVNRNNGADVNKRRVVIFGDSHAAHWLVGVEKVFDSSEYVVEQYTGTSCRSFDYRSNNTRCREFYDYFVSSVLPTLTDKDVLIVSNRWIGSYNELGADGFKSSVISSFELFKDSSAKILVVGNSPEFKMAPQSLIVGLNINADGDVYLKSEDFIKVNEVLQDLSYKFNFVFFNPSKYLCKPNNSLQCLVGSSGVFYYFDRGHFSIAGSAHAWEYFSSNYFGYFNRVFDDPERLIPAR